MSVPDDQSPEPVLNNGAWPVLDGRLKKLVQPALGQVAEKLVSRGITANAITVTGFILSIIAAIAISLQFYIAGLVVILLSRLCDGLDGAVARSGSGKHGPTDFGGFLDIVLDFGFYGMIPLAFVIADPSANAIAGAVLIFSFYFNGASFLAYAIIAEKRNMETVARGRKSIYFTTGLAEASETLITFVLFCLLPSWFSVIAIVFALITFYTTFSRIMLARSFLD